MFFFASVKQGLIKEIEQGLKREFIDTIQDPKEILSIVPNMVTSTTEELLVTLPTINTLMRFEIEGVSLQIEFSFVIELKDDNKENNSDAIGLATYSNSEATILSYASIFETLWIQSELQQRAS